MVIVVLKEESGLSQALSEKLGLPLVNEIPESYYFVFEGGELLIRDPRQGKHFSIQMDMLQELNIIKKQKISPKKDILCKAVGFKGESNYLVFDGTLGFAKDAIHLLALGASVVGYEKNPITFALLESALEKASDLKKHLSIFEGDCLKGLESWAQKVDCLYLDPMFENVKKKSAPKKYLAFLREITPVDLDVQRVIEKAIEQEVKRVVVKRPTNSEHLYGKPNIVFEGKLIRYDVYTR